MPRKGYKPTGYPIKRPDPVTFLGKNSAFNAELYAELAPCPLYAKVRILAPGLIGTKRESFYLGWVIDGARWARGKDHRHIPAELLRWCEPYIKEEYPSVAEATGMDAAEVAELIAEQKLKRAAHEKSRG